MKQQGRHGRENESGGGGSISPTPTEKKKEITAKLVAGIIALASVAAIYYFLV